MQRKNWLLKLQRPVFRFFCLPGRISCFSCKKLVLQQVLFLTRKENDMHPEFVQDEIAESVSRASGVDKEKILRLVRLSPKPEFGDFSLQCNPLSETGKNPP